MARTIVVTLIATLWPRTADAVDGTWTGGSDWGTAANWSSDPVVPVDTATFSSTGSATVDSSSFNYVGAIQFTAAPNAQAFTISNTADIFAVIGAGIFNNSASTQTFNVLGDNMIFLNGATASGGPGAVNIVNSSFLTFQDSSTAGSAAITNNATGFLNWYGSSSAGTATLTNDGSATFNDASTAGTAHITNSASGTLTFYNTSTAQGATIINNGGVLFANSSRAGTAAITNNQNLDFVDAASADHAAIANNAAITFGGTSTADHAAITYTANLASTQFSGSSSAGNATFQSNSGVQGNYTSFFNTSTAGSATIVNTQGVVSFTDTATAGSAAISNSDPLMAVGTYTSFALGSTAGTATITNGPFGETRFLDQSLGGSATIVNNPGGGTVFGSSGGSDTASAATASILNAAGPGGLGTGGYTEFFASTTAANATITTLNGAVVAFFDSSSGGAARFITEAGGAFDIAHLTAAGMTAGSIEGAGTWYLGDKQLTVGGNNLSTTVTGIVSDGSCGCFGPGGVGGSLVKVGSGTLTLAGINTYTGTTTVDAGTLSVNGSTALSALTTVNAGGTLGGNGIVGNTTINGGTLAPGNSIGTLTVQGNLVFTAAASYLVEVSTADSDLTRVTGTATLGGATVTANFAPGSYVARQYTIVNAVGGVIGTFGTQVSSNLPANFTSSLVYDANNAYLKLTLNFTPPTPPTPPEPPVTPSPPGFGGLTGNQQNVANALVNYFNTTGGIPLAFGALTPAGLTLASGELATAAQQTGFDAMNLFLGLLTDPFVAGRGDPGAAPPGALAFPAETPAARAGVYRKAPPPASFEQRWSVWAAGFGGAQTTQGNAALGSATATDRIYGGAVGADVRISPATIAGFALAGGGTSFGLADRPGSGRSDLFQAGAFVRHAAGPAYLSAALAYGWQDVSTDRTVTGADRLQAEFNTNALSGRLEGGYRLATPAIGLSPYAAGQFTTLYLPAYAERAAAGLNTFALGYGGRDVTAARSELGLRSEASVAVGDGILTTRGRLAWAHNFYTDRSIAAALQTLPGASFTVSGGAQAQDSALTSAAAEMRFASGLSLAATFEGEFSELTRFYAGKGVVRYVW